MTKRLEIITLNDSTTFLLDGERVEKSATPKSLELEDQDQIDVVLEQTGGC